MNKLNNNNKLSHPLLLSACPLVFTGTPDNPCTVSGRYKYTHQRGRQPRGWDTIVPQPLRGKVELQPPPLLHCERVVIITSNPHAQHFNYRLSKNIISTSSVYTQLSNFYIPQPVIACVYISFQHNSKY